MNFLEEVAVPIRRVSRSLTLTLSAPLSLLVAFTCPNGLPGVADGNICCAEACNGQCGGVGCGSIVGTNGASDCCSATIALTGVPCDDAAPCVMVDGTFTPAPVALVTMFPAATPAPLPLDFTPAPLPLDFTMAPTPTGQIVAPTTTPASVTPVTVAPGATPAPSFTMAPTPTGQIVAPTTTGDFGTGVPTVAPPVAAPTIAPTAGSIDNGASMSCLFVMAVCCGCGDVSVLICPCWQLMCR